MPSDFGVKKIKGTIKSLKEFYCQLINWGKKEDSYNYIEMMDGLKSIKEEYFQYEQIIQELMNSLINLELEHHEKDKKHFIENLEANGAIKMVVAMIRFINAKILPTGSDSKEGYVSSFLTLQQEENSPKESSVENKESYDCQHVGRFLMKNIIQQNLMLFSLCIENPTA